MYAVGVLDVLERANAVIYHLLMILILILFSLLVFFAGLKSNVVDVLTF